MKRLTALLLACLLAVPGLAWGEETAAAFSTDAQAAASWLDALDGIAGTKTKDLAASWEQMADGIDFFLDEAYENHLANRTEKAEASLKAAYLKGYETPRQADVVSLYHTGEQGEAVRKQFLVCAEWLAADENCENCWILRAQMIKLKYMIRAMSGFLDGNAEAGKVTWYRLGRQVDADPYIVGPCATVRQFFYALDRYGDFYSAYRENDPAKMRLLLDLECYCYYVPLYTQIGQLKQMDRYLSTVSQITSYLETIESGKEKIDLYSDQRMSRLMEDLNNREASLLACVTLTNKPPRPNPSYTVPGMAWYLTKEEVAEQARENGLELESADAEMEGNAASAAYRLKDVWQYAYLGLPIQNARIVFSEAGYPDSVILAMKDDASADESRCETAQRLIQAVLQHFGQPDAMILTVRAAESRDYLIPADEYGAVIRDAFLFGELSGMEPAALEMWNDNLGIIVQFGERIEMVIRYESENRPIRDVSSMPVFPVLNGRMQYRELIPAEEADK